MNTQRCLDELARTHEAVVLELNTSARDTARLAPLGIVRGCRVMMLRNGRSGAVLVEVRNTVVALSRLVARNITVGGVAHDDQ